MSPIDSITRRAALGAGALAALALGRFGPAAAAETIARGRVVEAHPHRTRPVPGVLVSNGLHVVRTDEDGRYALPVRDGVFVVKPAHWTVPLDVRTGAPAFAYTHRPFGSPSGLAHGGLAATGPLPQSIDFVLERSPEPAAFRAVLFADPQPADKRELAFLRSAMSKMCAEHKFAFGVGLGDIASDNLGVYDDYQREAARLGVPVWHIPGNHDHDTDAPDARFRLDTWRGRFGPPTYAFEHAGALFVMLDNVHVRPGGSYVGRIGEAGLAFVRNLLALTSPEKLVVLCTHIPLTSSLAEDPSCATSDAADLLRLIEGRRAVSFSGHMHTSEHHYLPMPTGPHHHHQVISALSGSWWSGPFDTLGRPLSISSDGTPHGWHSLSIDGDDYHTAFTPARDDAVARLILGQGRSEAACGASLEIVRADIASKDLLVNVFDGGPRTSVFVDMGGARHALRRVHLADPYTEQMFREAGASLKFWVRAEKSSHLWVLDGDVPATALEGARLTLVDEFGRTRIEGAELFRS